MADRGGIVQVIIKAKDLASSVVGRFRRTLGGITRVAKDVTRAIVGFTVAMAAAVIGLEKLAERGSKVLAVKRTFAKLTRDEADALEQLREASSETIADFDLMALHNQALALGSAKTTAEFAEQIRVTRILGRAQGLEATESLEKFTVGMARQSKLRLDDLGIQLEQVEADKRYAAQLGRSAASLTEGEKKIAFRNEAMRQALLLVDQLSAGEDAGADAANRFSTAMANLGDKLATTAAEAPVVTALFDQLTGIASDIIDIIGGEADTLVDGMKTIGRIMGNAMAVGMSEGIAATIGTIPILGFPGKKFWEHNSKVAQESLEANIIALGAVARLAVSEAEERGITGPRNRFEAMIHQPAGTGGGRGATTPPPAAAVAGIFPGFTGTNAQLLALLEKLKETREDLETARLDFALSTTEEAAKSAKEKVDELAASLALLENLFEGSSGETLALIAGGRRPSGVGAALSRPGAFSGAPGGPTLGRPSLSFRSERLFAEQAEKKKKALSEAEKSILKAQGVTAAAIGGAANAVIAGSQSIASSLTSMITQILQASTMNPLTGAIIGSVGGILGTLFRRRESQPQPVSVRDYGARALDQLRDVNGGPTRITTIIEQGGVEIGRIERELLDRAARDETVRFGSVTGMGS